MQEQQILTTVTTQRPAVTKQAEVQRILTINTVLKPGAIVQIQTVMLPLMTNTAARQEATKKHQADTLLMTSMVTKPEVIKQTQTAQLQAMTSTETKQVRSKRILPAEQQNMINMATKSEALNKMGAE